MSHSLFNITKRGLNIGLLRIEATVIKGKKSIINAGITFLSSSGTQLSNETTEVLEIIEIQVGDYFGEDDIVDLTTNI